MATSGARLGPTDQQRAAIERRDVSVALSAGAGCGKTYVLTERFLAHLEPATEADAAAQLGRLIAITFTERAAREMRDRVRRKVRERLLTAPDDAQAAYWLEVLRRLESAQISTIHSFCGSLLRAHAVEAGLDPRFGILEASEASTLLTELIDDELRRRLTEADPAMLDLTTAYDLNGLRQMIASVLRERYRLRIADWAERSPDELAARWEAYFNDEVVPLLRRELVDSPAWRDLRRLAADVPPPHPTLGARCAALDECRERAIAGDDLAPICRTVQEQARIKGADAKKAWEGLEDEKRRYGELLTDLREAAKKIEAKASFDATAARPAARATLQLLALSQPIAEAYETRKRELGRLDFDDLMLKARDLLTAPQHRSLRRRFSLGIELLLVDECQDTDPLQAELIDALCGGDLAAGKLFFVGDYKQSIYRFRRADPDVFLNLRGAVPQRGRLPLTLNFRSRPAILEFVNALFGDAFGADFEPLEAARPQSTPRPAIEFLWATAAGGRATTDDVAATDDPAGDDADDERGVEALRRIEAEWIARRIRQIVDEGRPELVDDRTGERRAVRYGDVAVLLRAMSNVAVYEGALERYGIDYYVVGGKAFYGQQEVFDLLNFLKTLDSACDETALVGVLRSPFFNLRDDTLLLLAEAGGSLTSGLFERKRWPEVAADERPRVEFAARTLRELRGLKNRLPIAGLLNEMSARTGYDAALVAEFLGTRKLANLRKLIDQARVFDRSGVFTLSDFIAQLSEAVAKQPDEAPAAMHAEGSNVVRLMTIHQAKGLEFPVVIVPDLNRREPPQRGAFAFDDRLGPAVKSPDGEAVTGVELFHTTERVQAAAESLRVFYVAVTRAADHLILSSGVSAHGEAQEWRRHLSTRFDLNDGTFLGSASDLPAPEVRVTSQIPPQPAAAKRPDRPDWPKLLEALDAERAGDAPQRPRGTDPIGVDAAARRRFSFSRLSGSLEPAEIAEGEAAPAVDAVVSVERLDPLSFGTLVHGVLARVDYHRPSDVGRLIERQARLTLDGAADDLSTATEMLTAFLASPRADEVRSARRVYRELEFLLAWPPNRDAGDGVYLEGFLDLLYQDPAGGWHVVDFKSHRGAGRDVRTAAAPYEMQLRIYALAAERILGAAPAELVVHFLHGGGEHRFLWDDAARRRVVAAVDRAVAALRSPAAEARA